MKKSSPYTVFHVVNKSGNTESSYCVGRHKYAHVYPYCTIIELKRPEPPHVTHAHDSCEMHFIARGRMVFHTERGVEFLSANDALITMPGERHGNGYCTHARTVVCMLMLGFENDGSLTGLEPESARLLGKGIRKMKRRHFYAGPRVLDCFNRVRRIDSDDPYAALRYRMCITDLLIALFDAEASPQQRPLSREIRLSSSYIGKHACGRFDMDALAARLHLTPSGFRHRFLRETGMAPKEYLMRERVRLAADRIRRGGGDLTSVAYASGFSSSQYFARIFRRYTGQTPRDYQLSPGTFA